MFVLYGWVSLSLLTLLNAVSPDSCVLYQFMYILFYNSTISLHTDMAVSILMCPSFFVKSLIITKKYYRTFINMRCPISILDAFEH